MMFERFEKKIRDVELLRNVGLIKLCNCKGCIMTKELLGEDIYSNSYRLLGSDYYLCLSFNNLGFNWYVGCPNHAIEFSNLVDGKTFISFEEVLDALQPNDVERVAFNLNLFR